jgi:hypothetical protein
MLKTKRTIGILAVSFLIGALAATFGPAPTGAATAGHGAHVPAPEIALSEAKLNVPFSVRTPRFLPTGLTLARVEHQASGDSGSVDMWYADAKGTPVLHVWQSNATDLGDKDPSRTGDQLDIEGVPWRAVSAHRVAHSLSVVSTRTPDGLVVSVDVLDGTTAAPSLHRVAGSLR